jgi:hypothetical protein
MGCSIGEPKLTGLRDGMWDALEHMTSEMGEKRILRADMREMIHFSLFTFHSSRA